MLPNDLPPWSLVYQQCNAGWKAGCHGKMVHDLRVLPGLADGRKAHPSAAIIDSRTIQSTPSSTGTGYDGAKRKRASRCIWRLFTLGHLLAMSRRRTNKTAASVGKLVQAAGKKPVLQSKSPLLIKGYTGDTAANEAGEHGVELRG